MELKPIYTTGGYEDVKKKYPNITEDEDIKFLAPYATRMRIFFWTSLGELALAAICAALFTIFYFIPELYKSSSWPALFLMILVVIVLFNANAYFITKHSLEQLAIEIEEKNEN